MNVAARHDPIARLLQENEGLRAEIARLKELLAPTYAFPPKWKLSPSETIVLRTLMARKPYATLDALYAALYEDWGLDVPNTHILAVLVSKTRRKLAPVGIGIINYHSRGYGLTPEGRAVITRALEG